MNTRPRILFSMSHAGFFRNFERSIDALDRRGYEVRLLFTKKHKVIKPESYPALQSGKYHVVREKVDTPVGLLPVLTLRVYRDILFYAGETFAEATSLLERFPDHQKGRVSRKSFLFWLKIFRSMPGSLRKMLDRLFELLEVSSAPAEAAGRILDEEKPNLLVVTPLVHFFTHEIELVKAAKRRNIPVVFPVASWDNLTNKGIVKAQADLVAVWNSAMAEEATRLHKVAADKVVITGAPVFDWWFDKSEIWGSNEFLEATGQTAIDPSDNAATLLYLCSSESIASGEEVDLVKNWVSKLRASTDPRLRNARVVVRMHPMAMGGWKSELERQAEQGPLPDGFSIYPTKVMHPTNIEHQRGFMNAVHHADAIVGLNTSAMIEATIMGRPVLTFRGHKAEKSQSQNLHFQHLESSGCVRLSETLEEHIADLAKVLDESSEVQRSSTSFVERFIRPNGLDVEAGECLAQEIDIFFNDNKKSER